MAEIQSQGSSRWAPRVRKSGLHAFVMKFLFDQTIAGFVNIVLFVALINLLKGASFGRVWELVLEVRLSALFFCNPPLKEIDYAIFSRAYGLIIE